MCICSSWSSYYPKKGIRLQLRIYIQHMGFVYVIYFDYLRMNKKFPKKFTLESFWVTPPCSISIILLWSTSAMCSNVQQCEEISSIHLSIYISFVSTCTILCRQGSWKYGSVSCVVYQVSEFWAQVRRGLLIIFKSSSLHSLDIYLHSLDISTQSV